MSQIILRTHKAMLHWPQFSLQWILFSWHKKTHKNKDTTKHVFFITCMVVYLFLWAFLCNGRRIFLSTGRVSHHCEMIWWDVALSYKYQTDRQTDRQTSRQTDRKTDRQTDGQTDRQTQRDRKIDRETEEQRQRGRQTDRHFLWSYLPPPFELTSFRCEILVSFLIC